MLAVTSVAWIRRGCALALLAVALTGAAFTSLARADGDPASDYLVTKQVFLPSASPAASASEQQLLGLVRAANRAGFPIRVAVIASDYDLGSITALWQRPRLYARFLGLELSQAYKQRLLVVMPNGFGFNWPGHSTRSAYQLLAKVPISSSTGPLDAAQTGVRRLAAAAGVTIRAPTGERVTHPASPGSSDDWAVIIAAGLAVLAAALAVLEALRRRRSAQPKVASGPSAAKHSGLPIGRRWLISGFAVLMVVAVGAPIAALSVFRPASADSSIPAGQVVTAPPFSWPAGRRPAPDFVLRDQQGRVASPAAYRGRPVIVTFVDPLCRNLCPLEAHVLNAAVDQLPASQRPEILAVSVDVYARANARANLLRDVHKWSLVPQWHWAVGPRARLAAIWKGYKIGVSVTTKKIAGTTINYITHTEAAYVIDATGHERALFLWPFYPQDVERTVRQLG